MGKTDTAIKTRWNAEHYTRISIYLPKEDALAYKTRCEAEGRPMSDIPKEAIYEFLKGEHK